MQQQSTTSTVVEETIQKVIALAEETADDVGAFESGCMRELMALGRAMMKRYLERLSPSSSFVEEGVTWRVAVESQLRVMTIFGPVKVKRCLFRSRRNGPTRCLISEKSPLIGGFWTEQAAKIGAQAVAEMPMERAEKFFAEAGFMPVSRSSLLRLAGWLSDLWEEDRAEHEAAVRHRERVPDEATTVAVSLDGVMVLTTDSNKGERKAAARARGHADKGPAGWREASVGVISFYDADGERLQTRRYGRMPEADKVTTKSWLRNELEHVRAIRPDLATVAIADGAANNWSFLEDLHADHEVVDFFHAAEHLHRHVGKANGASTLDTQQKLQTMRHELLDVPGGASKVFEDVQKLRERAGTEAVSTKKKTGKRQPTFFERHHKRMDYAQLREKNLPIGSGVTESTCKLTICDRLRRTGMRWTLPGGQAVVTLRAHLVSNTFDSAWDVITASNRQRIAA